MENATRSCRTSSITLCSVLTAPVLHVTRLDQTKEAGEECVACLSVCASLRIECHTCCAGTSWLKSASCVPKAYIYCYNVCKCVEFIRMIMLVYRNQSSLCDLLREGPVRAFSCVRESCGGGAAEQVSRLLVPLSSAPGSVRASQPARQPWPRLPRCRRQRPRSGPCSCACVARPASPRTESTQESPVELGGLCIRGKSTHKN